MLGDFGLYAKRTYYEGSANIPCILMGLPGDRRIGTDRVDDRLVGLQDVMPTLLELAGLPVPETCEGMSMVGERRRSTLYGDCLENAGAGRMIHDGRHKLIWYPAGNSFQLFDLEADPQELHDLAGEPGPCGDAAAPRGGAGGRDLRQRRRAGLDQGRQAHRLSTRGPMCRSQTARSRASAGLHYPQPPQAAQDRMVGFPQ